MKLRKLHIDNYKMFKDFDISFVDKEDKPLPIVILAGVNGSGKTSLLEYLLKIRKGTEFENSNGKSISNLFEDSQEQLIEDVAGNFIGIASGKNSNQYDNNIVYYPTNTNLKNIKTLLPKYIENMIFVDGVAPFDSYKKVTNYMNEILKELDVQIEFDSRDGEGNLFFRDKSGGDKFSIDELSTGEKTLMSKVLYLYLEDIKNKVILIDEPELSLHPSWQNKVLKIYENFAKNKDNNCQIIIATHSPHVIGSAKNESIRLLVKEDNQIKVVDNIDKSYGLQFDKILTDIMGVENLRTPAVAKDIKRLWELLENEAYESEEYIKLYSELEDILGSLDEDMVLSRLEIARIKSRNANSK